MTSSSAFPYSELQCKTNFSFLRGASDAAELILRARELGMQALALNDVNGVYALPRAYEAIQSQCAGNDFDLKLISGAELKLIDHPPLTLLAQNRAGYGALCRLLTAAHQGKEKGHAALSVPEFLEKAEGQGLIAFCSVPLREESVKALQFGPLRELFGDRFFLSLSFYLDGLDERRVDSTLRQARSHGLRVLATNDVHYHVPERRALQDAMTCVREGVTLRTAGFKLFGNEERYLKSPVQMHSLFRGHLECIEASNEVAASCGFSLSELSYRYPSEWIPQGNTAQQYLEELVWKGAHHRYRGQIPIEVEKQVLHELHLTQKMGYADYFLTVYDIVDFAKRQNIYCQGRGSAANSVICYCLGITVIDPVRSHLLFERFISEERGEPPDIDVDFEHERREEVIQYIYQKYGRDRAAMVSAVRTYRRRSALLEMSKAVGVPVGVLSARELEENFEQHAGPLTAKRPKIEALVSELKGFPRHLSIHACGFTLSADPIIDTVPVEPARMEKRTICQWDKNDLDTLKLIKVDVLSLGFLSAIHKACDLIGIHFSEIPQEEDPKVYGMIQKGDTIGTFQIESRAQISTLGVTRPECFYDLVVEVALVRPGPNVGEMKHPYIQRRDNARRGIPYVFDDPVTEKILGRTFGVPIFQEQVMKLAIEKAGFSGGEADQLRRAIAAWRSAQAVDAMSERFYRGLIQGGMSEERAKEFFGYLKGFSAYGFPESHAASFAILSYLSAWLKFYHPTELLIGLLNSQPMGFYSIDVLLGDAMRHGVKVLPIHPNRSEWDSTREAIGTVRMGFRTVRGMRESDFQLLQSERAKQGFQSLQDFLSRTAFSKEVIETLAMADLFSCFGMDQRHSFWKSIELKNLLARTTSQQLELFSVRDERAQGMPGAPVFDPMKRSEAIQEDYRGTRFSLRGNQMAAFRAQILEGGGEAALAKLPKMKSSELKCLPAGAAASYLGTVQIIQRPPTAKGVAFITLEDEWGSVDLVLFKKVYERFQEVITKSPVLLVKGRIERRGESVSMLVGWVGGYNSLVTR